MNWDWLGLWLTRNTRKQTGLGFLLGGSLLLCFTTQSYHPKLLCFTTRTPISSMFNRFISIVYTVFQLVNKNGYRFDKIKVIFLKELIRYHPKNFLIKKVVILLKKNEN
jgi:hypothetical protein